VLAAILILDLFTIGLAPIDPGKLPRDQLSAAACETCHAETHAEWRKSRHGLAWTNSIFQREYRTRPLAWCVHCHAPLSAQVEEVRKSGGGELAAEGVNCAVCHLRDGKILAARKRERSPHNVSITPELDQPSFCGGCHQFGFPRFDPTDGDKVAGYFGEPMQDTVRQHARGPHAPTPCQGCHARSAAKHLHPGAHDLDMLKQALSMSVCRVRDALRISIKNRGAGHNVPTGDVHRHLALRVWRPSAPEKLHETLFGRTFEPLADGGKRILTDTTLPPQAERTITVSLASLSVARSPRDTPRVELRYIYTIDEFPLRPGELAEPTWVTVYTDSQPAPRCSN
jgi:hypothetical protein